MAAALTATYSSDLSRVQLAATGLDDTATKALFERSTNGITWTTVRGGTAVPVSSGAAALDDYEFAADVENTYRVTASDVDGTQTDQTTATVTPALGSVWIKSLTRPFLNRAVNVVAPSGATITRKARNGVFDVVGRSNPIAVTDLRAGRAFDLVVTTETAAEAAEFDLILASGDPIFLHTPAEGSPVPTMYAVIGDTSQTRQGSVRTERRYFTLPLTEVAPPTASLAGATVTWAGVIAHYATWADLIADKATWADVLQIIGSPSDVIVS